jgi:hypothetical protein
MDDVGIFKAILSIFRPIVFVLWPFWGHLVYFSRFGMLYGEKSGNPFIKAR